MGTKPEGFFWWQKGKFEDDKLQQDLRERLPNWYGSSGYIDFQVTSDSISVDSSKGKAVLHIAVEEGQSYQIGGFQITGNRRFSTEDLTALYPFGPDGGAGQPFNSTEWSSATENVTTLYSNNGYIYAQIAPEESRRTGPNGEPLIDLRWAIREGQPAIINKINIVGNDVTHERVVREAVVLAPGRAVQPRPADPELSQHRQPRLLPAADGLPRREDDRQRRRRGRHLPGGGAADRQHQLRRIAGAGHRAGRVPGAGRAQSVRPGQARQAAVAVRAEHQRLHPQLHRSRHPRDPDLRARSRCSIRGSASPSATWAAAARSAAACSWASPSWGRASPGSMPPTACSRSSSPAARRISGPGIAAPTAPARPWAAA